MGPDSPSVKPLVLLYMVLAVGPSLKYVLPWSTASTSGSGALGVVRFGSRFARTIDELGLFIES